MADPTFPVSVESFFDTWTQPSWLMRLSYPWWLAHLSGRCRYLTNSAMTSKTPFMCIAFLAGLTGDLNLKMAAPCALP